jgi:hypothetical protein
MHLHSPFKTMPCYAMRASPCRAPVSGAAPAVVGKEAPVPAQHERRAQEVAMGAAMARAIQLVQPQHPHS